MHKKAAIIVLDGWGIGKKDDSDAVWKANTPFTDNLTLTCPNTTLKTFGENVGLPDGQMGNSEVGHMNIGAGRVVWQMLVRINREIRNNTLSNNAMWLKAKNVAKNGKDLHLIGLVSDGGVHSHMNHLIALCNDAVSFGIERIYIHAFLDGRDTDPNGGLGYIKQLKENISPKAKISTIVGRYYAMDRDNRWERTAVAYNLMVHGVGEYFTDVEAAITRQYENQITDEFMKPLRFLPNMEGLIKNGDVVLCFNYRTDRGRQITEALSQNDVKSEALKKLNIHYFTLTEYDSKFTIDGVLFENQNLNMTLGEVISLNGLKQMRAAETEKYPHVSYFFSGGRENEFVGETRLLVHSPKVATYDLQPEMSAVALTENAIAEIAKSEPDFYILNFANADMVGHTGVFPAIVKAVETVDACLHKLVDFSIQNGYQVLIIADHGNADFAVNLDGSPNTAHSMNPVPCWLVGSEMDVKLNPGILADIAPTILNLMHIKQPDEMTGKSLLA